MIKQFFSYSGYQKVTETLSVLSFLTAVVATFLTPLMFVAVILGHIALLDKNQKNNRIVNTCAKTGLVIGYALMVITVILMTYFLMFTS